MDPEQYGREINALVKQLRPIIAGHPPEIQGGALADCMAIHVAGHLVLDDAEATRELRASVLEMLVDLVQQLIEPNAKEMGTWQDARRPE